MLKIKDEKKILKEYFSKQPDISMAFIFGSYAKKRAIAESDFDLAIYFKPQSEELEWEEDKFYEKENIIWREVEALINKDVDLAVLNRTSSTLAFEVLRTGVPVIVKDHLLYLRFISRISFEAIDFMDVVDDYWAIEQRSFSLNAIDRQRLIRALDFLEKELADKDYFANLDLQTYHGDANTRRNVERWVENIVNCSIDMAKILLASEKKRIPDSYKEMLKNLNLLPEFDEETALQLADFTKLRNILAHEYLDIRFKQIEKFIQEAMPAYQKLAAFVKVMIF